MLILGIDPGTATTGYGIVRKEGDRTVAIAFGAIVTSPKETPACRVKSIYDQVGKLMDTYHPDVLVTERLFFAKNETTAFSVGRTMGVVLLCAAQRGIEWVEYTPMQVKQAVVGYGGAEKKQMQYMVQRILKLDEPPKPDDVADALAVCICHAHSALLKSLAERTSRGSDK
ncbi:MAG: crossover junction endodeoxyribonuclease RuvC [Armatimonadetes bacterium]|nr:crossover junction endodeoxyribonuclease RuvC [Armatimonadota bacterium]